MDDHEVEDGVLAADGFLGSRGAHILGNESYQVNMITRTSWDPSMTMKTTQTLQLGNY